MKFQIIEIDDVTEQELEVLLHQLPKWRRERALRYKYPQGRKECAVSYLLLQEMLAEQGICDTEPFTVSEHGKPYLSKHPDVFFNISHCKHAVACCVSTDAEVGVDIECRNRYVESLARHVLSESEMQFILEAEDTDLEFTRLWTQKEALFKLVGSGLTDDIRTILEQSIDVEIKTMVFDNYVVSTAIYK